MSETTPGVGNLWLIGMMGAGKSVVGRRVAEATGLTFVDIDAEVVARTGCSIATLWGDAGEEAFRDMEAAAIARAASMAGQVVATGGGAVLRNENVQAMKSSGLVVWLRARPSVLAGRVEPDGSRPLLAETDPRDRLGEILEDRSRHYAGAAEVAIDTDDLSADEVALEVEAVWNAS